VVEFFAGLGAVGGADDGFVLLGGPQRVFLGSV